MRRPLGAVRSWSAVMPESRGWARLEWRGGLEPEPCVWPGVGTRSEWEAEGHEVEERLDAAHDRARLEHGDAVLRPVHDRTDGARIRDDARQRPAPYAAVAAPGRRGDRHQD